MDSADDERLVRAALADRAPDLDGVDPERLGTAGWRSLVLLDAHLPAGSSWGKRVHGMRRSYFYSTSIASGLAVTLCERLANPVVFGDLAMATAHSHRAGDRPVGWLAVHVGGDTDPDELAAILASLPDAGPVSGRQLVRTQVNGMTVALHRSWPPLMAPPSAVLDAAAVPVETAAGSFPVASRTIEALRILSNGQQNPHDPSWLLDLAAIAPDEQMFAEIAVHAQRLRRQTAVIASWSQAHRFGIAPAPPEMSDPLPAVLSQRMALSSHRVGRAIGYRLLRHGARA